jgi:hypothetical protein
MDVVLERIAAWEAAGLIDSAAAARLREAETSRSATVAAPAAPAQEVGMSAPGAARRAAVPLAGAFGPAVSIVEMFAYLGGAFLLGAYGAFVGRIAASSDSRDLIGGTGAALAALVVAAAGLWLRGGDARRRRAAGVFFAVATGAAALSGWAFATAAGLTSTQVNVAAAVVATLAAIAFRAIQPALLTQATLLGASTALAAFVLDWLQSIVDPGQRFDDFGNPVLTGRPDPLPVLLFAAAWWLAFAVILGVLALREDGGHVADREAAGRRAGLTRLWAGLVAVVGLATAMTRSDYRAANDFGRVLEPWVGDALLLALAGVLVERAFRRDATAFIVAAAIAVITALSDFNFTYLSSSTEVGLLLEGLILLGAGFAADRLRRRVGGAGPGQPATPAAA